MKLQTRVLLCATLVMLGSGKASSQEVLEFSTYAEALDTLLDPASGFANGAVSEQTCNLFADSLDINAPAVAATVEELQSLGPNLRRHCDLLEQNNSGVGSILSGGLSSFQSTRTVSQFSLRRRSNTSQLKSDDSAPEIDKPSPETLQQLSKSNLNSFYTRLTPIVGPNSGLNTSRYQSFNRFAIESIDNVESEFSSHSDIVKVSGQIGVLKQLTTQYFLGATLDMSVTDGSSDNILDSRCNIASSGEEDGYSAGVSILQTLLLNDYVILSANLEGATFKDSYSRSLCLLTEETDIFFPDPEDEFHEPASINERFEGIISGEPTGQSVKAVIEARGSFPAGAFIINPRVGFNGSETTIDGYSESDSGNTGATLLYDSRDVSSRVAQWGLSVELPIPSRQGIVSPFLDVVGFREHGDGQQRLVAQFVEDNRQEPTRFSFLSTPVDRNYAMAAIGVDWYYRPGAFGQIKFQSLFGNDYSDARLLEARIVFNF